MRTPVRFLCLMTGCGLGACVFAVIHGQPMLGLKVLGGLVVGAVIVVAVLVVARERAYNRRAAVDFAAVLAHDAAHHASNGVEPEQVSR